MAKKFLISIDLAKNEIQNAVSHLLSSAPGSPVEGQFYYDTTDHRWKYRTNSAWVDPLNRSDHTGTQTASTISDFDTQVRSNRLDQMANPTASVSLNSQKITNLANGTSANDAVNYSQLQSVLQGRTFKDAVRVATTAALPTNTYSNGTSGVGATLTGNSNGALAAVDGVTLSANDELLVKNESATETNGIYVVTQVGSGGTPYILTRRTDADNNTKIKEGMSVQVAEGTANGDTQWTLSTDAPITIGTTGLTFVQTGAGTTYTQGTGISISGATIAIDTSVTARHVAANVGNGSATSIAITHNLNTRDVVVNVYDASSYATVECDVTRNSVNQVTLDFAVAPASNAYRVVVVG